MLLARHMPALVFVPIELRSLWPAAYLKRRPKTSEQIKDEAHEIRYLGNDMAHGDFTEPVSEEDADDMLGFLATFLNYVYQMPAAIRRRQEARKNRRANPNV